MTTPFLPSWAENGNDPRLDDFGRAYERCPVCGSHYCGGECEQEGEL